MKFLKTVVVICVLLLNVLLFVLPGPMPESL